MLPLNTNIRLAYANGKDDEQNFIQNLSLFLCTFLKEHGQLIEKRLNLRETLMEVGQNIFSGRNLIFNTWDWRRSGNRGSPDVRGSTTLKNAVPMRSFLSVISCFLRLSTTCSSCQRWRRPRSSKFVWSIGTTWQQNSTEKVRSPRPHLLCCPGTSTSTFHRAGSSICQCSPRCCQHYQTYQLYWCHIILNESIMC